MGPFAHLRRYANNALPRAWLALAMGALAISACYAVVLAAGRAPGIGGLGFIRDLSKPALVMHVNFSVVVWLLAYSAALWDARPGRQWVAAGWSGFAFAAAGAAMMASAPLVARAPVIMSNYVPVLDHPLFLIGLALFAVGVAAQLARAGLARAPERAEDPVQDLLRLALWPALAGMIVLIVGWLRMPTGLPPADHYEHLMWGPGHLLQFSYTLVMMAVWTALAMAAGVRLPAARGIHRAGVLTSSVAVFSGLALAAFQSPQSAEYRNGFTWLMAAASWPAPIWFAGTIAAGMRGRGDVIRNPFVLAMMLSAALFALGIGLGAAIHADNVMVPAHYHGAVGAVTLAAMALFPGLVGEMNAAAPSRGACWRSWCYAIGLAAMMLGFAWGGWMGMARKNPLPPDDWAGIAAMALMWCGAVTAVFAQVMFVASAVEAMRSAARERALLLRGARWLRGLAFSAIDARRRSIALTLVSVAVLGAAIALAPGMGPGAGASSAAQRDAAHTIEKIRAETQSRFTQGVIMLHAKQYEHALTAFHRVLELNPELPEAHVNMGYALLGLQRYQAARDFFESAAALRPAQANAYYGLAIALEGAGDLAGAVGAMRTYVHLSTAQDEHVRKAHSALWEWEQQLARKRGVPVPATAAR